MVPGAGVEPARYFYRGILSFLVHLNHFKTVDLYRHKHHKNTLSEPFGAQLGHKNSCRCDTVLKIFN